ncbi:hypothetical protein M413DRAFT_23480 [Hebeloma cylindrosporum]|uniref:Uncharacterized protein n=1 Tax=Hebeloma cylindrosporum TaxID=76867 RepID=A0A0C3CTR0_HEBCY|nr:hypothetical protein M413DRAFT_23480 [Hebeloma cylindrosporum h7]
MATALKKGRRIPMNFTAGTEILVFKGPPTDVRFLLTNTNHLDLFNEKGDILLRISLKPSDGIYCVDRAHKSLGNGFGEEKKCSRPLEPFWEYGACTISVHHYSTDSESGHFLQT